MTKNKALTNEWLNKRFDNPFSLVNYAIEIAKNLVQRGEERESNTANDVVEMIRENRDKIEESEREEVEEKTQS